VNRLHRAVVGLLLLVAGVANVSAEARSPIPSSMKELSKRGIRLDAPVHMTADTISYDEDTGVAVAEGNVELALGTRTMRADRIRYDSATGEADLSGKVRYKDTGEEFAFDRITINLDSEKGVLYNGSIRISSSNYQILSQRIEKTGKDSFLIEKGSLTTCPCDPEPDWRIEVRRARVTLDQYAVGKDVTFRVRGVPVLWLPWGAFPVKMTRQSGFLLPNFSSNSSRGFTLTVPYYQVINRWSDATVTLDAMSHRGYRPEVEYRFVLNPESEGALRATYFRDREEQENRGRFYGKTFSVPVPSPRTRFWKCPPIPGITSTWSTIPRSWRRVSPDRKGSSPPRGGSRNTRSRSCGTRTFRRFPGRTIPRRWYRTTP